jgi:hypothetical protein
MLTNSMPAKCLVIPRDETATAARVIPPSIERPAGQDTVNGFAISLVTHIVGLRPPAKGSNDVGNISLDGSCSDCRTVMQRDSSPGLRGWRRPSCDTQTERKRLVPKLSEDARAAIDVAASTQAVQPEPYISLFKKYAV